MQRRDADTLIPLIKEYVESGSRNFTDCWTGYSSLKFEGFEHYTVNHKTNFKVIYTNEETGENVTVHTNRIEGAWKHAKVIIILYNLRSFVQMSVK